MDKIELVAPEEAEDVLCEDVRQEEARDMLELGKKMIEYCHMTGAVGLACPQIGIKKKMFVYRKTENSFQVVINPTFYPVGKRPIRVLEGCMSLKKKSYLVSCYKEIQAVLYVWETDKLVKRGYSLTGNKAIIFQHECRHIGKFGTDELGQTIRQYGTPIVGQEDSPVEPLVDAINEDGDLVKKVDTLKEEIKTLEEEIDGEIKLEE